MAAGSVTSKISGVKVSPNSCDRRSASACLRTLPNTWKPLAVSTLTQPQPMPVEAPVTTTDRRAAIGLRSGDDRRVGAAAPFGPRAVIDRRFRCAGEIERQSDHAGGDAGAAARGHLLSGIDAGGLDPRAELRGR